MTYVRPSWWLPGLEIGWGIITGLIALCQNAQQVYVLRVLLGIFESSAWPGMMTLFMYWYTPTEIAKRMGFYHSCQAVGSMMSGALQTAILETVDGAHGIAGWRWLFIINCGMTLAVGLAGFWMLPDYPSRPNPRAFWFTPAHSRMAQERLERHGRSEAKKITWAAAKRAAGMWVTYFIPVLYIGTVLAQYGYNYFSLFLKSVKNPDGTPRWTTSEVNAIPIGGGAINVVFVWIWAILSDAFQTRWVLIIAQAVIGLVPAITMSIWTRNPTGTPISAAYASFFLSYLSLGTAPLIMAWLSDLIPQDPEARTLTLGYSIAGVYASEYDPNCAHAVTGRTVLIAAVIAWSQVLVWPASEAPYCKSSPWGPSPWRRRLQQAPTPRPLTLHRPICLASLHRPVDFRDGHGCLPAIHGYPLSFVSGHMRHDAALLFATLADSDGRPARLVAHPTVVGVGKDDEEAEAANSSGLPVDAKRTKTATVA